MSSETDPDAESSDEPNSREWIDAESLIDRLAQSGVITSVDGSAGGELRPTDEFVDLLQDCRRAVADADPTTLQEEFEGLVDDVARAEDLIASIDVDEDVTAEYLALVRADVDGLDHAHRVQALPLLDALVHGVADDGSPGHFVPVRGSLLPVLLPLYERAVVYTWKHDCPPCDLMEETFEAVFDEPPDDVALFSVYGPDSADLLHEHYDVIGGPTVLYFHEGVVDARLTGAHAEAIVESEIRKLREA